MILVFPYILQFLVEHVILTSCPSAPSEILFISSGAQPLNAATCAPIIACVNCDPITTRLLFVVGPIVSDIHPNPSPNTLAVP